MSQAGYTASEALAALAILGLAMGGLTSGIALIGQHQSRAQGHLRQAGLQGALDNRLTQMLAPQAPFRSDEAAHLVGQARALEYSCGAQRCSARIENGALVTQDASGAKTALALPVNDDPSFWYVGTASAGAVWPPAPLPPPAPSWQLLRAVVIKNRGEATGRPLAVARLWQQQRSDCEYDTVIQDCRGAGS